MSLRRVISGGQTGVDQAALRAARSAGIATGGVAPRLFMTEDGPEPALAGFGLVECPEPRADPPRPDRGPALDRWVASLHPPRTRANARDADVTLWLGPIDSRGFETTRRACQAFGKPMLIAADDPSRLRRVLDWIEAEKARVLNVAGNRESVSPGIGARAERFLTALFRELKAIG